MKYYFYVLLVSYLLTNNCGSFNFETVQNLKNIDVQIEPNIKNDTSINYAQIISEEYLLEARFLNANTGWIISKTELFKTENGGNSWQNIKLYLPEKATFKDIYFVSQNLGWIVVERNEITSNPVTDSYHFWLLKTTDGGKTWIHTYEGTDAKIFQVYFINENNGWIIGEKYIKSPQWNRFALISRTNDQGKTWVDESQNINKTLLQPFGGLNEQVRYIWSINSENTFLLTSKRKIFRNIDNRGDWSFEREIPYEKNRKIKIANDEYLSDLDFSALDLGENINNKLWIAGNLYDQSLHTTHLRGELSVEKEKNLWTNFLFNGFIINDVKFLSDQKIILCGSWNGESREGGAVLYSSNGGYNWNTLYFNEETKNLHNISILSPNQVLVVGEKGKIVKLEISPPV